MRLALVSCSEAMCTKLVVLTAYGPPGLCLRSRDDLGVNSFLGVQLARLFFFGVTVSALRIILCKTVSQHHHRSASRIWHSWHCCNTIKRSPIDCGATVVVSRLDMDNWVDAAINDASTSISLLFCKRDTHTHTRLTALFRDYPDKPVPERQNQSGFYRSKRQWHQLGHKQVCTSLQTDNHASTPPLSFLQAGCPSCCSTNSVKALKAKRYTACNIH